MWFHKYKNPTHTRASIRRLNDSCFSSLWHGILARVGDSITSQIHKHVKVITRPIKQNEFHRCGSFVPNKMSKQPHHRTPTHKKSKVKYTFLEEHSADDPEALDGKDIIDRNPGLHFHIDFGVFRGT